LVLPSEPTQKQAQLYMVVVVAVVVAAWLVDL
jgi:hypothetical protein